SRLRLPDRRCDGALAILGYGRPCSARLLFAATAVISPFVAIIVITAAARFVRHSRSATAIGIAVAAILIPHSATEFPVKPAIKALASPRPASRPFRVEYASYASSDAKLI